MSASAGNDDRPPASPEEPEPDPESFEEVARDNILIKVAVALLITLAVFALLFALAG